MKRVTNPRFVKKSRKQLGIVDLDSYVKRRTER